MRIKLLFGFLIYATILFSQERISGKIIDKNTNISVPFATVVLNNNVVGTTANKNGEFSLEYSLSAKDTLMFKSLGYQTRNIPYSVLKGSNAYVFLEKEITELNTVIIGGHLDAKSIVKKILDNKNVNYKSTSKKEKVFLKIGTSNDVDELNLGYKKITIPWLSESKIDKIKETVPKHTLYQTSFIGDLYFTEEDNNFLKLDPERVVKHNNSGNFDEIEVFKSFVKMLSNTAEKEYWKVKSGVFGHKIDLKKDTIHKKKQPRNIKRLKRKVSKIPYIKEFDDKESWEFLHKTNRYEYENLGITVLNNDEVYKIKFKPKKKGLYKGLLYITVDNYALVKANYEFETDRTSNNRKLLGLFRSRNNYKQSVLFKKIKDHYELNFYAFEIYENYGVDRKIALQKKKDRFLFDKTLEEVKLDFYIKMNQKTIYEYLVLDNEEITIQDFNAFKESKKYVPEILEEDLTEGVLLNQSVINEIERNKYLEF